jgi:NDP-sugar pyrophosphorylase family protein
MQNRKNHKALIFAAGLGTRLKPLTDTMPKALVPIAGKSLLEHIILKLKAAGFTEIIVNIHHFGEQIIDFLQKKNNFDIRIEISDERDFLLDTGGGISKAAWFFDDNQPFLVHNVDIISNVNLAELYCNHLKNNALATLVVSERATQRYFFFDEENILKGWTNIKTGEVKPNALDLASQNLRKLAFSGIQVLSPQVFDSLNQITAQKFSITDFYISQVNQQKISGFVPQNYRMLDVGKIDILSEAEAFLQSSNFSG